MTVCLSDQVFVPLCYLFLLNYPSLPLSSLYSHCLYVMCAVDEAGPNIRLALKIQQRAAFKLCCKIGWHFKKPTDSLNCTWHKDIMAGVVSLLSLVLKSESYRWTHGIRVITEVCKSMGNHHVSPLLRPAKLEITLLAMRWCWRGSQQLWCRITVTGLLIMKQAIGFIRKMIS